MPKVDGDATGDLIPISGFGMPADGRQRTAGTRNGQGFPPLFRFRPGLPRAASRDPHGVRKSTSSNPAISAQSSS